jgi:SAM-dependent methyltransferase
VASARASKGLGTVVSRVRAAAGPRPLSEQFGLDRGRPILRLYAEEFLEQHADDIRGHCLEFEGRDYVDRYGGAGVTAVDVLHLDDSNPAATIVADLTDHVHLPERRFDCIVCTFVLHVIFDLPAAVAGLHRLLRPGGVLLVAVPGVSMADPGCPELWRFTPEGLRRTLNIAFAERDLSVRAYGNSLTGAAQLRGLVAEELTSAELAHHDERFAVLVCARARRAGGEPEPGGDGWDAYARAWRPERFAPGPGDRTEFLGDEWTHERPGPGVTTYGLPAAALEDFAGYLSRELLDPHLPSPARAGLEIGPGGGRLTELLLPRAEVLHVAEPSLEMIAHLRRRFPDAPTLRIHHTDGRTLPALAPGSLDFVASLDVFVHFDPQLVFWYLRQLTGLLAPGGVGVIHYANTLTQGGFEEFVTALEPRLRGERPLGAFGVLTPELMMRFAEALGLELVCADTGALPRDAVAVFRSSPEGGSP